MNNYYNALAEVDTILNYLIEEDYNKIPKNIIEAIKKNKNNDYVFQYNENIELKNQELSAETKAILFNLFRDYLCTPEQKEKIKRWQQEDRIKAEKKKNEKYNYEDLFKRKENKISIVENGNDYQEKRLMKYHQSLFEKIKEWLTSMLIKFKNNKK